MGDQLDLVVARVREPGRDVRVYDLVAPCSGQWLPAFTAGSHLAFDLPSGLVRHYSLCSDPAERSFYSIAVKREASGRGGSAEMHRWLARDVRLKTGLPMNNFPLGDHPGEAVLIGGGIGITPLVSMLTTLERAGRPHRLIHLVRERAEAIFADVLNARLPDGRAHLHIDAEAGGVFPVGNFLRSLPPDAHIYCCGPTPLMTAVQREGRATRFKPEQLHFEWFTPKPDASSGHATSFTVTLGRSGRSFAVPADRSILEVLLAAGVDVDYSCAEGTCGTCVVRLIGGEAEHRDSVLTEAEKSTHIAVCCSRARSETLVIDF